MEKQIERFIGNLFSKFEKLYEQLRKGLNKKVDLILSNQHKNPTETREELIKAAIDICRKLKNSNNYILLNKELQAGAELLKYTGFIKINYRIINSLPVLVIELTDFGRKKINSDNISFEGVREELESST